jgi:MoxR-like ATPase
MNDASSPFSVERIFELAQQTLSTIGETVLGQRHAAEVLVSAYLAGGHVLLYGVPGIGKTLLARVFAACLGVPFARVQFTPDLMPTDVTGINVFEQSSKSFRLVKGPVFTPYALDDDFFVIATQNPIEFEGTYPLPEAQLDRFLVRIEMGIPAREDEMRIYREAVDGALSGWGSQPALPAALVSPEEAKALRGASRRVHVADEVLEYLARLAAAVRSSPHVELGISPRGALAALEVARGWALVAGRDFLSPDDLKRMLIASWEHRLVVTAESELEGYTPRRVVEEAADSVEVPR